MKNRILTLMLLLSTVCLAEKPPEANAISAPAKTSEKPVGENISPNPDAEEVIFRNLPAPFASAQSYTFLLQKGVASRIYAFLPETPTARMELISPSGQKTPFAQSAIRRFSGSKNHQPGRKRNVEAEYFRPPRQI